ncbi:MAG: CcmD family protein [Acidobacteriota bacterium]|nr:CcmD family protein [Acidobacteriota bacterium]
MSFLFAGYLAVWTIIFLYLVYLTKSQKQVNAKLQELSDKLKASSDQ